MTNVYKLFYDKIEEEIDYFDFEKVAKTMSNLDWKIVGEKGNYFIPEANELKKIVRKISREVVDKYIWNCVYDPSFEHYFYIETAGWHISVMNGNFTIKFVVTDNLECNLFENYENEKRESWTLS